MPRSLEGVKESLSQLREMLDPGDWVGRNLCVLLTEVVDNMIVSVDSGGCCGENRDRKGKQGCCHECHDEPICSRPD